ncbi:dTDP-4-dehydrorhamnose 3,5-epimerase [Paenibacillus hunanensis]|uniref:dTDP-4-dehydrorhamnose 3,5-epimerase n=1 Tax=Paenibacillus hunanensis TaxID=539262 RepID=UPI0020262146|nr:dTDP-4-dehydrorhamnose 3,5-epimerase [Paenibacillus hunanensis]MCL9662837.1 dTDP-4-dehydrorhamnose 3,5-epimerase [Paenibacillus hunanensis]
MKVISLRLESAKLLTPTIYGDSRGHFMESYNMKRLYEIGIEHDFVQDNESLSVKPGVLRGLHYQLAPKAQAKLVRVTAGAIYDVIVDIRPDSTTFGQWQGFILSQYNQRQLYVPHGFAHGFCTLVPNTQVFYKVDEYYSPECDRGIRWDDPYLNIDWPVDKPILSDKDQTHPLFKEAELN